MQIDDDGDCYLFLRRTQSVTFVNPRNHDVCVFSVSAYKLRVLVDFVNGSSVAKERAPLSSLDLPCQDSRQLFPDTCVEHTYIISLKHDCMESLSIPRGGSFGRTMMMTIVCPYMQDVAEHAVCL